MATSPANGAHPLIGKSPGQFEIVELIGRGGMGAVYKARQPSLDRSGEARVSDFGLAKHTEGDVEVTADGTVVGTPAYVAPETAKALLEDLNGLGKLQSVGAAARAEAHAMLREAPTLEMTEGKRREREARAEAQRPKSKQTTLIAAAAIVAIIAIAAIVVALRSRPKPPPTATKPPSSVPQAPTPVGSVDLRASLRSVRP